MEDSFLWSRWEKGKSLPAWIHPQLDISDENNTNVFYFWEMLIEGRVQRIRQWQQRIKGGEPGEMMEAIENVKSLALENRELCMDSELRVLKEARIIGATTSGAAKYQSLLSSISPEVVLVEEAGEVLEAHVLTSLSASTEHLMLIGDHKQLPPKVEQYNLTTTSGGGYNLDCSLFERLVMQGHPSVALEVQHRMRPSISALISEQTYPTLKDHRSVQQYPNVKGVTKNVVFVDHDVPEDGVEGEASTTKTNIFEAEFAVEIVRYFLLQGYNADQIVVLTPYLGQLAQLVKLTKKHLQVVTAAVSERDVIDLESLENGSTLDDGKQALEEKKVRCSSIDNFQGEEADFVVISLVRSNARGSIGFLRERQRVNGLLSRARLGMFILGNSSTLKASQAGCIVWEPVIKQL